MSVLAPLVAALLSLPPGPAPKAPLDTAVLAGGCFWGVEGVFEHVKGVTQVISGYADSAESVEIIFDPSRVTFDQLLVVFFMVAHDPTEVNRQGPDIGTEYRSIAFYRSPAQLQSVKDAITRLQQRHVYADPVVTEVASLRAFYPAEAGHQGFMQHHLSDPYIVANDLDKLDALKNRYSTLYRAEWHD